MEELEKLRMELYSLLEKKKEHDMAFVSIDKDASDVVREIDKILKNKNEEMRKEIFMAGISITRREMEKEALNCKELFYSLPTKLKSLMKNNSEKLEELEIEEVKYKESIFDRETHDVVKKFYRKIDEESYDRSELEEYEEFCNNLFKKKSSVFGIKDASGRILGEFNKGMYDNTREKIIEMYKENGFKVSSTERFIDSMSDELLKYRIIGLYILSRYCEKVEKEWEKNVTDSLSCVSKEQYDKIKKRAKELGVIMKEEYIDNYNKTPLEEITRNTAGAQSIMIDAFPKLKRMIEDENGKKR